jgi:V/A-type H+-transporting ATPase subunit I
VQEILQAHPDTTPTGTEPKQLVEKVWKLIHQEKELKEKLQALEHEHARIAPFGEFDPRKIQKLIDEGLVVKLLEVSLKKEIKVPDGVSITEISRDKNTRYLLAVGREEFDLSNTHEVRLPDRSLSRIDHHLEKTRKALEETQKEFARYAGDKKLADDIVQEAEESVHYLEVHQGMGDADAVVYLSGYFPFDQEDALLEAAAENGWGYKIEEVSEADNPPTLLRNPKWVSPVKAILKMIDVLPGYRELDVSALFLIFLSIFFAFIIGDAGYGLLFIGLTLFGKFKAKGKPAAQPGLNLMLIMSAATVIFGVLTGNYFGIPIDSLPDWLSGLTSSYMSGWSGDGWNSDLAANHIMFICFSIAVVHLSIAHLWNIVRKINSPAVLIDLGWLLCTWSLYAVVLELVLDVKLFPMVQTIKMPLIGAGVLSIIVGLILTKSYIGLITLFLDVISNFVDIISYIRLYAVGAASLSVAQAFNEMALGVGFHGVAALGAALILFAGHGLNIILGAMGVMVHGIRLNTLEFSGHAGVEWAGIPFAPFKKREKEI